MDSSPRADLEVARRELERWRRDRPRGARIPEELWLAAAELGHRHGVSRTSQALHLDYYALQRRMAGGEGDVSGVAAGFVEVSLPAVPGAGVCDVEVAGASGGHVRMRVSGLSARDLAAFVRAVVARHEP